MSAIALATADVKLVFDEAMAGKPSYVYILKSQTFSEQTYIGLTDDLYDRLLRHNRGEVSSTSRYQPWNLVFYCCFPDRTTASIFEAYLKTGSGRAFIKRHLIQS